MRGKVAARARARVLKPRAQRPLRAGARPDCRGARRGPPLRRRNDGGTGTTAGLGTGSADKGISAGMALERSMTGVG